MPNPKTNPESLVPSFTPSAKIPEIFFEFICISFGHFILGITPYSSNVWARITQRYWVKFE